MNLISLKEIRMKNKNLHKKFVFTAVLSAIRKDLWLENAPSRFTVSTFMFVVVYTFVTFVFIEVPYQTSNLEYSCCLPCVPKNVYSKQKLKL